LGAQKIVGIARMLP